MNVLHNPVFSRNFGFFSKAEQQRLADVRVAIAGVGGDGFQLGEKLARMGISRFTVADPEVFEEENINRVTGARRSTLGRNKADVFRELVVDIHPNAQVRVFTEGVTASNVSSFAAGADLIVDESELTRLDIATMISREAHREATPVLMVLNIGFGAIGTSFLDGQSKTFEQVMGIPQGMPLAEVQELRPNFTRYLAHLPPYGDYNTLREVVAGAPLPSIAPGVDAACALGSTEAMLHLVRNTGNRRRQPTWAPRWRFLDAYQGRAGVVRWPRLAFYRGAAVLTVRTKLGLNPRGAYSVAERQARNR